MSCRLVVGAGAADAASQVGDSGGAAFGQQDRTVTCIPRKPVGVVGPHGGQGYRVDDPRGSAGPPVNPTADNTLDSRVGRFAALPPQPMKVIVHDRRRNPLRRTSSGSRGFVNR